VRIARAAGLGSGVRQPVARSAGCTPTTDPFRPAGTNSLCFPASRDFSPQTPPSDREIKPLRSNSLAARAGNSCRPSREPNTPNWELNYPHGRTPKQNRKENPCLRPVESQKTYIQPTSAILTRDWALCEADWRRGRGEGGSMVVAGSRPLAPVSAPAAGL